MPPTDVGDDRRSPISSRDGSFLRRSQETIVVKEETIARDDR